MVRCCHRAGPGAVGLPRLLSTACSAMVTQAQGWDQCASGACFTPALSSEALQVGPWLWKMKSVLSVSQTNPSRNPCVGIDWHFQSLSYHQVEITKAMLLTGINQFWLYFAGLKSNHIFFNWGGETNIESTQRISSVTTAIQTGRAAGPRRAWGANPPECHRRAEHDALQRDTLLLNSLTFPPETATASPALPPTPATRKARKENPSFHVAGCVLRWLLTCGWCQVGEVQDMQQLHSERGTAGYLKWYRRCSHEENSTFLVWGSLFWFLFWGISFELWRLTFLKAFWKMFRFSLLFPEKVQECWVGLLDFNEGRKCRTKTIKRYLNELESGWQNWCKLYNLLLE